MAKIKGKVSKFIIILVIGGLGGILADQFFLPYLSTIPFFSKIGFIQQAGNGTTIINPTEKIIVTENTALEQAIDKVDHRLVAVHAYQGKRTINQATGLIVTSDGLIVTASDAVSIMADQYLVFRNGDIVDAQVIKRDSENNLALLRIEQNNLPVVSLTDLEDLHLGQRVILIGMELIDSSLNRFVNLGVIRSINQGVLKLNLEENNILANGGPLVNIKGEVIGLNLINQKGLFKIISADKIKEFIE
jgi:S1-C subfamily serine protease|tara:strand:- start:2915 stop:3655 length:741 start_codon:yes stop_codon:yes gene_type:complete